MDIGYLKKIGLELAKTFGVDKTPSDSLLGTHAKRKALQDKLMRVLPPEATDKKRMDDWCASRSILFPPHVVLYGTNADSTLAACEYLFANGVCHYNHFENTWCDDQPAIQLSFNHKTDKSSLPEIKDANSLFDVIELWYLTTKVEKKQSNNITGTYYKLGLKLETKFLPGGQPVLEVSTHWFAISK